MIRRENSDFLRKKQTQWDREKADAESRSEWFPFGENLTPGGGSPLRKFAPKEPKEAMKLLPTASEEPTMSHHSSSNNSTLNHVENRESRRNTPEKMEKSMGSGEESRKEERQESVPYHHHPYQYPIYAFPMQHPAAHHQMMMMMNPQMIPNQNSSPNQSENQHQHHPNDSEDSNSRMLQNPVGNAPIGQFFAPQYQVIPAGAIPVSTINIDPSQICPVDQMGMWTMPPPTGPNGMRYGIPIPAPFVPQIMTASATSSASQHLQNLQNTAMTTSSTDSSSESGVSGVKDDEVASSEEKRRKSSAAKNREDERQSTSDYTDDDPIPLSRRNTSTSASSGYNYQEQIAERRRYEAEEENRERLEMLEVERQRRILEDRRRDEEEKRKRADAERFEEDRRRADQFAAAMEKARKEAELLKKAKLYKHVLRGAEEEGGQEHLEELEQKILGVDGQTGRRLLKEVSDVEWHKKQDQVEMAKKAPQREKNGAVADANGSLVQQTTHRARSNSIIAVGPPPPSAFPPTNSPFARNTFGRRSVRTTSREKQEITVVDTGKPLKEQLNGQKTMRRSEAAPLRPATAAPAPPPPRHLHQSHQNLATTTTASSPESAPRGAVSHQYPSVDRPTALTESNGNSLQQEMLKSANFYCPINREPLSFREETRVASYKPPTPQNASRFDTARTNEITQSALFGPISTRLSTRRGQMRGIGGVQSPPSVRCPPPQQRTSSFEESSSGGEDAGSISPNLSHKNFESPLPSSTENVHPAPNSPPAKNEKNLEIGEPGCEYAKSIRTRSALGSPMSMLNGGDSPVITRCSSPSASRLMQRLELKGHIRRDDEHISQDVRRIADTNLSRSPSMASLRGSIQNLSIRGSHLNLAGGSAAEPSPNLSKFASVNSPARQSLTSLRKTTDRQTAVLERLSRLRESLHAGKNFTPPPRGLPTSRITTPAQTPPISPRPVL